MDPNQTPETPESTTPAPVAPASTDPGHGLGIASLILAFLVAPVGVVLGIVALLKSKKAGKKNGLALAGIIVGALGTLGGIVAAVMIGSAVALVANTCHDLGSGVHVVNGATYTCGDAVTPTTVNY